MKVKLVWQCIYAESQAPVWKSPVPLSIDVVIGVAQEWQMPEADYNVFTKLWHYGYLSEP